MEAAAQQLNVPSEVIRVLAAHGRVRVSVPGQGAGELVFVAPFEDILHLFVAPQSAIIEGLMRSNRLELSAKADDSSYQVRMTGRAHAGRRLGGHPLSSVLEPWAPEDGMSHRWTVVPFVPEEIEFVRGEGDEVKRNAGLTRAGRERPTWGKIWLSSTFFGMATPQALIFITACTIWFGLQGAEFVGRPIGLTLSLVSGLSLIGGSRLFVLAQGFMQWRENRAARADAPWASEGFIAPHEARLAGATLTAISVICFSSLWLIWGTDMVFRVFVGTGIWLALPASVLHLAMGRPEPRR